MIRLNHQQNNKPTQNDKQRTTKSTIKMKILLHADDYGNSRSITNNILDCMNGALTGTSIIPNGSAFDYGIEKFMELPLGKIVRVHLNLIEGVACGNKDDIPFLINTAGYFKHSFMSVFFSYYLKPYKRREIARQVKVELSAQIGKVIKHLPEGTALQLDSHQHLHMIPFIFKILINLKNRFPITYIRVPKEKFFLLISKDTIGNYLGANLIKHILLNKLSNMAIPLIKNSGIKYPDYFVGVLFTGKMTHQNIEAAIRKIKKDKSFNDNQTIEILLHPGGASHDEEDIWKDYTGLKKFYLSTSRHIEKESILQITDLNKLI